MVWTANRRRRKENGKRNHLVLGIPQVFGTAKTKGNHFSTGHLLAVGTVN